MNELNRLYEYILQAFGCKIDQNSKVACVMLGKEYPLRIDGRDLHLPTSEALSAGSDQKVYFHPTCESITSKETEVFKLTRRLAGIRLLSVFRSMVPVLIEVAGKKEKKSWTQNVYDVISPLASLKKTTKDELFKLLSHLTVEVENNIDNRFIHFKITKGGKDQNGERVYYKAKPSFPLYDVLVRELARSEGQPKNTMVNVNDFQLSRETIEIAVHLFRSIIPAVNNPDTAEFDAVIPVAARFTAFMYCFANIASQLNRAQNMFRGDFDKKSVYNIDVNWEEQLEEIPEFYRQVPELDYNTHNVYKEGEQQNNALGGNMNNLFSINSQQVIQPQQMPQGTQGAQGEVRNINGIEYVMTVPPMMYGDRYQRSEPNQIAQRVNHYAIDMNNQIVIYVCSRLGNFLHREAMQQQYQQYGYQQSVYPQQAQPMYPVQQFDMYGRPIAPPQQVSPYAPNYGQQAPSAGASVGTDPIDSAW